MSLEDAERELRIELMQVQIDHGRVNLDKMRQEMRWEPWKALAALFAAGALFVGSVLALSSWTGHQPPQQINVHLDAPLFAPQRTP
jgi:hypothetical protein